MGFGALLQGRGEEDTHGVRSSKATKMPTARMMHMKRIWMIQKGMRTAFNQGEDFAIAAAAIAAVDTISSPPQIKRNNNDIVNKKDQVEPPRLKEALSLSLPRHTENVTSKYFLFRAHMYLYVVGQLLIKEIQGNLSKQTTATKLPPSLLLSFSHTKQRSTAISDTIIVTLDKKNEYTFPPPYMPKMVRRTCLTLLYSLTCSRDESDSEMNSHPYARKG